MGILLSIKINDALFLLYLLLKDKVMQRLNTVSCCCCCFFFCPFMSYSVIFSNTCLCVCLFFT